MMNNNKHPMEQEKMTNQTIVYENKPADFAPKVEVGATFVNVGTKILLLQLAPGKSEAGAWGVPAGKCEVNETPAKGASRELFEETGIHINTDLLQSFGQLYIRKPEIDYVYHLFGVVLDKLPTILLSNEHCAYRWCTRLEAETLVLMDGEKEALDLHCRWQLVSSPLELF